MPLSARYATFLLLARNSTAASITSNCGAPALVVQVHPLPGGGPTVMVTVSVALALPSLTVSWNVRSVGSLTTGALKPATAPLAPASVTSGPAVLVQV